MAGIAPGTQADAAVGPGVGHLVGGRYRLDELLRSPATDLTSTDGAVLWRAEDQILSRPVAVRILVGAPDAIRHAFLAAAATGCRANDPLVAATYDAAEFSAESLAADTAPVGTPADGDRHTETAVGCESTPIAYVVREWVVGHTLRDLLIEGPLAPERATAIVQDTALALAHLHELGVAHGRVHPANVLVHEDGQIRLCDAGIGACLHPDSIPATLEEQLQADTIGLGQTLYAALTGRWPDGEWRGLPPAPHSKTDPHALPARQVRAGVSRELDAVTSQLLGLDPRTDHPAPLTAAAVAAALSALPNETPDPLGTLFMGRPPATNVKKGANPRRTRLMLATIVVVIGIAFWLAGRVLGTEHGPSTNIPTFTAPPASAGAPATGPVLPINAVTSFDPPPGDGSENTAQVFAAHDGQFSTAWQTQTYTTANLGNAKPGVGLLVDLGIARQIREVNLTFLNAGTNVEIRAMAPNATAPGTTSADFSTVVASESNAKTAITESTNATTRYVLIWLTKLPKVGSGYRGSIAEMAFHS